MQRTNKQLATVQLHFMRATHYHLTFPVHKTQHCLQHSRMWQWQHEAGSFWLRNAKGASGGRGSIDWRLAADSGANRNRSQLRRSGNFYFYLACNQIRIPAEYYSVLFVRLRVEREVRGGGRWELYVEIICIAFDENHKELMNCSMERKEQREGAMQGAEIN